jgi:hypothetical protein
MSADALLLLVSVSFALLLTTVLSFVPNAKPQNHLVQILALVFLYPVMMIISFICLRFASYVAFEQPKHPLAELRREIRGSILNRRSFARYVGPYVAMALFMTTFTAGKNHIAVINPFAWDQTFDWLDTAMHFGVRPWELLHPILGYWPITLILGINYAAWFFMMWAAWAHFMFVEKPGFERTRYFLSFMLTWAVGGVFFGTLLSSAGPCYFDEVTGLSTYAPLMDYLKATSEIVPVWALMTQEQLWNNGDIVGGISAMPSMHNGTALLLMLVMWNRGRVQRIVGTAHAVLIYLASIHLGWHYAVDAYLAWIIAFAAWKMSGVIARWWEGQAPQQTFRQLMASEAA